MSVREASRICGEGETSCVGQCVDTARDPLNCGGCGVMCGAGQVCSSDSCVCDAAHRDCDGDGSCWCDVGAGKKCDQNACSTPRPADLGCEDDRRTVLLIHSNDPDQSGDIVDSSSHGNRIKVCDVHQSTTAHRLGSAAMHFKGTSSYLALRDNWLSLLAASGSHLRGRQSSIA